MHLWFLASLFLTLSWASSAQQVEALAGTQPLTAQGDLSASMVLGIDRFLMREIERSIGERAKFWPRDFSSREAYEKSIEPNRQHLQRYIGAVDPRVDFRALEYISSSAAAASVAETEGYCVYGVRWPVFDDVDGEGLLLQPKKEAIARVVVIPDADETPEMLAGLAPGIPFESQTARRLAENGCQVIVPVLIDRQDIWSGNVSLRRFTNQPHREWIYRQAYEMGRHVIGYEVQKVLAAVDWLVKEAGPEAVQGPGSLPIGVAGYSEGGLIAFYSAALDTRIAAALVSGYFGSRQRVWEEPVYRNVFGLLEQFGDAEIASLIAPRSLIIEHSQAPQIIGPPSPREGRSGAAPGKLTTPPLDVVQREIDRAKAFFPQFFPIRVDCVYDKDGGPVAPGSERGLSAFLQSLGVRESLRAAPAKPPLDEGRHLEPTARQKRQVQQLVNHTQRLLQLSEGARDEFFWRKLKPGSTNGWETATKQFKDYLWDEVIGRFPKASLSANPRTRKILDKPKWTAYDVVLDVWPDVFAWGILLTPKDLKPGERRPVVVFQHGLEGVPLDTLNEDPNSSGYKYYKALPERLAESGFIGFAPHNPYRGGDAFRVLQRKANPLKKSLFSIILAQHDRILDWLSELPFVDPQRIGFYGLSYGGKTAMRVPSLLDRYCLSICSADFNDWVRKNVTTDSPYSYLFTGEYEMVEFNLGQTLSYAEMAALIAPRPFMVERGHNDGVAPDEWVAYEYAKVRRLYDSLGIGERTAIEFFNGPHTINGVGTVDFLRQHVNWPAH